MRYKQRGVLLCLALVGLVAGGATPGWPDEPVVSNMELMSRLTGEAVEKLLAQVPKSVDARDVVLVPYALDERYEFIDNVFTRILTSKGYRVYAGPGSNNNSQSTREGFVLEYQAMDFSLVYPKIYRAYLIGGRRVQRTADVKLMAKVLDAHDDSVVWIGEAGRSHKDQFGYGELATVEAGVFAFTKPPRQTTNWGKIAEPVVVSGIIVGLIYLFFSNQTDS